MRCSKSCYLYDLELVDLFEDTVIEQVYYKKAETILKAAEKRFSKDYRIVQRTITLYAAQKNKKETLKAAEKLFALAPENPAVSQIIIGNL